jgi:hypothetical protein
VEQYTEINKQKFKYVTKQNKGLFTSFAGCRKKSSKNYNYPSFVMAIFEEENLCNQFNLSNVF